MKDATLYLMTRRQLLDFAAYAARETVAWHDERSFIIEHIRRHTVEQLDLGDHKQIGFLLRQTVTGFAALPLLAKKVSDVLQPYTVTAPSPEPGASQHTAAEVYREMDRW